MLKLPSPSSAGGTVTGAGGVGGSVGTSVGLTTARQNRHTCIKLKLCNSKEIGRFQKLLWECVWEHCPLHTLALNWHRGSYLTRPLLYADSRSLQVGGLGVHCGVVKSVRGQAIEAVASLRASDSDLLSSTLGGWRTRTDSSCNNLTISKSCSTQRSLCVTE